MATIEDVAREAGVSISTVSYALSGKRRISTETQERIRIAAERLGYEPNASARALAARRSDIIAVTAPKHPDTDPTAHMVFAMEVTTAARQRNFDTLLLVHDGAVEGMRRSAARALADGIIVLDVSANDERVALARTLSCPTVFMGLPHDTAGLTCVDLDFERAMRHSINRLHELGHRSVALIGPHVETMAREPNYLVRLVTEFERRAKELGIEHTSCFPTSDDAGEALRAIGATLPSVTGIVLATTNDLAFSLNATLNAWCVRVPDDVSVIAAGMTPTASRTPLPFDALPLDPALTCPVAVQALIDLIEGTGPSASITLVPPVYLHKGSVGHAPVASGLARHIHDQ